MPVIKTNYSKVEQAQLSSANIIVGKITQPTQANTNALPSPIQKYGPTKTKYFSSQTAF